MLLLVLAAELLATMAVVALAAPQLSLLWFRVVLCSFTFSVVMVVVVVVVVVGSLAAHIFPSSSNPHRHCRLEDSLRRIPDSTTCAARAQLGHRG